MQFKHVLFFVSSSFFVSSAVAADCQRMCCDAVVPSVSPKGNVGIGCELGGNDCFFGGQVEACCVRFVPNGAKNGTAIGCQ